MAITQFPDWFAERVDTTAANGCWAWTACVDRAGYGRIGRRNVASLLPHRMAYLWAKGDIPAGLEIDHLCRNRACVNPDHLEAVTHQENMLRGDTCAARNAAKTECDHGHPFDAENTYINPTGHRECKVCRKEASRRARARRRVGV